MAERTFKRRFQQATGLSPLEYVQTLRLDEDKHLLGGALVRKHRCARQRDERDEGQPERLVPDREDH